MYLCIYYFDYYLSQESNIDTTAVNEEIEYDKSKFPFKKFIFMFISYSIFVLFAVITLTKVLTDNFSSKICNSEYWFYAGLFTLIQLILFYFSSKITLTQFTRRKDIGYRFCKYDLNWTWSILVKILSISVLIGITAGSLGVGGGIMIGPLILELGVEPIVATHTTNFLVVFSSSSTLIQYYFEGLFAWEYFVFIVIFPLISSIIGTKLMHYIITKTKKEFPLLFVLSFVLISSSLMLLINGFHKVYLKENKYELLYVEDFCAA